MQKISLTANSSSLTMVLAPSSLGVVTQKHLKIDTGVQPPHFLLLGGFFMSTIRAFFSYGEGEQPIQHRKTEKVVRHLPVTMFLSPRRQSFPQIAGSNIGENVL